MTSTHLAKHSTDYDKDDNESEKIVNEDIKKNIDKKEKGKQHLSTYFV